MNKIMMAAILAAAGLLVNGSRSLADDGQGIHAAVRAGDIDLVEAVLNDSPRLADARSALDQTPLHTAALAGLNTPRDRATRERLTRMLLNAGGEVDAADQESMTPLHLAAMKGRAGMADLLLAAGAKVDARDRHGRTPLHLAAQGNHVDLIERLLAAGAELNAADGSGNTPLHEAARRFRAEAARKLIAAGADVNAANAEGMTPLHMAASARPAEVREVDLLATAVAEALLAGGAEVNAKDANGQTPLTRALDRKHHRLAKMLEQHGGEGAATGESSVGTRDTWPTFAEVGARLQAAETAYPSICRRFNLGSSYGGRAIWAVEISDNVTLEEDEPEFKYISTMHGDEITGVEMCLRLVEYLTANYGTDPQVTNLVDEVDIWIVPLMNPDGYDRSPRSRYNNQGVDLNRNFPDPYTSPLNTPAGRAPETGVIMNWTFGKSFTLSANFHGGALVANYPFDTNASGSSVYTASPDDDLFIYISEEYSSRNLPMWNGVFYHGITNGADWYAINGGMQDWSYIYQGCNEITIEISNDKQPPATQIQSFWDDNRASMLAYLETCLIGVRGIVTNGNTGLPMAATVTVVGRDHQIFTDPDVGDYHRMLLPGTYTLRFEAPGFDAVEVPGVVVSAGPATRLDMQMGPSAQVAWPNGGETLTVGVPTTITWSGNPAAQFHVQYTTNYGASSGVTDGFERTLLGPDYTTGGNANWFITTGSYHAGTRSAEAGNINDSQYTYLERVIDGGDLSFWYKVSSETNYDFFNFYINGARQLHVSGAGNWAYYSTTLAAGTHTLKWEYTKDGSVSSGSDTVWIDDLQLTVDDTTWSDVIAQTGTGATSTSWTPSVPSTSCKVRVRAYYGGSSYGAWDESDSTFTVEPSVTLPGDLDNDGDVDLNDFATFARCFSGAGATSPPPSCAQGEFDACDFESDGDVDLNDFSTLANYFTG
jgi:carboxypeptidase D